MLERLTQKDREFIKHQVASGYYASDIEVVRDAVRRLREKHRRKNFIIYAQWRTRGMNSFYVAKARR